VVAWLVSEQPQVKKGTYRDVQLRNLRFPLNKDYQFQKKIYKFGTHSKIQRIINTIKTLKKFLYKFHQLKDHKISYNTLNPKI